VVKAGRRPPRRRARSGLEGGEHDARLARVGWAIVGPGTALRFSARPSVAAKVWACGPEVWASVQASRKLASPYIRASAMGLAPNPSCTVEGVAQERWDPSETAALFGPRMSTVTHPSRRTRPPPQPWAAARRRAPLGTRPLSRKRQSATISLRASATMAVLRTPLLSEPTRSPNQRLKALSG
jgi:hypothetical protein